MYQALIFLLVPFVLALDTDLATVQTAFDTANIPMNASITFDPSILLEVTFPQPSGWPVTLQAGMQLPVNSTVGPPIFSIVADPGAPICDTFVVAAIDLDAPTPQAPTFAQIRHFLGGNFHPRNMGRRKKSQYSLLSNSTPALPSSDWLQPAPPPGSDPHRYVFLLFNQPAGFDQNTTPFVNSTSPITNFNISTFIAGVGLGNPVGGTFMMVGPDPST